MSKFVSKVVVFFGGTELHRVAAGVIVTLVAVQSFLAANGAMVGFDATSLKEALSVVGVVIVLAREVNSPSLVPYIKALLVSRPAPPPPPKPAA